jgi:hypothetical protein
MPLNVTLEGDTPIAGGVVTVNETFTVCGEFEAVFEATETVAL